MKETVVPSRILKLRRRQKLENMGKGSVVQGKLRPSGRGTTIRGSLTLLAPAGRAGFRASTSRQSVL